MQWFLRLYEEGTDLNIDWYMMNDWNLPGIHFYFYFNANGQLSSVSNFIIKLVLMLKAYLGSIRASGSSRFTQSMALTSRFSCAGANGRHEDVTWKPGNGSLQQVTSGSVLVRAVLKTIATSF